VLLSAAIFIMISVQPLAHPAVAAAEQGIRFTSSLGPTVFRVAFAGIPLGCAAFLAYCLLSSRRTLTGLIFSALVLGSFWLSVSTAWRLTQVSSKACLWSRLRLRSWPSRL
jgi:hypothetical protein